MFINKRFATVNTNQRVARREPAHQPGQAVLVHVLNTAYTVEEITVLSPLIAERATQVTGFGRISWTTVATGSLTTASARTPHTVSPTRAVAADCASTSAQSENNL